MLTRQNKRNQSHSIDAFDFTLRPTIADQNKQSKNSNLGTIRPFIPPDLTHNNFLEDFDKQSERKKCFKHVATKNKHSQQKNIKIKKIT